MSDSEYTAQIAQRGCGTLSRRFADLLRAMHWIRKQKGRLGLAYRKARIIDQQGRTLYRDRGQQGA